MKVAIVGGGASGLVVLKYLVTAPQYFDIGPIEVMLFESEGEIGGTFQYRVYEDAELVSSKYLTAFSDFRLSKETPDFVTPKEYCNYLKRYVTHFGLEKHIQLNSKVESVKRLGPHGHVVTVKGPSGEFEWECDAVAVCSGLNVYPDMPHIEGIHRVSEVYHSSEIKARSQFGVGKSVMVLGAGETGHDMAHLAITSPTSSVALCHRDGFFCGPKIIPRPVIMNGLFGKPDPRHANKPVDSSVASLFDTAYVPPMLQKSQMLWDYYNNWIRRSHTMISGTTNGPDQWAGLIGEERRHVDSVFFCKSDRALPYISPPYRSKSLANRIRSWFINVPIKDTGGRIIDLAPWPKRINKDGTIEFQDNGRPEYHVMRGKSVKPDILVFATGFKKKFPFLDESDYPVPATANVRGIYKDDDVTVAFIGFIRPSLGAIPPIAEMQTQLWVYRLLQSKFPKEMPPPAIGRKPVFPNTIAHYEMDWALHSRGGYDFFARKGGVDHESYVYQLALDIGSAPTWTYVFRKGWKVFYTWAMGPNYNTKFRLAGPWKSEEEAIEIMKTEQFNVVKRTGGFVYFMTYTIFPFMIFGTMSLTIHAVSGVTNGIKAFGRAVRGIFGRPSGAVKLV